MLVIFLIGEVVLALLKVGTQEHDTAVKRI
jgi:hypothetical protein